MVAPDELHRRIAPFHPVVLAPLQAVVNHQHLHVREATLFDCAPHKVIPLVTAEAADKADHNSITRLSHGAGPRQQLGQDGEILVHLDVLKARLAIHLGKLMRYRQ